MKHLLDTSFLIDYLFDLPEAVSAFGRLFESPEPMFITEIAVAELAVGVPDGELASLRALIEPLEFVQPGPETALRAGQWRRDSRSAGATLSLADALIAAAAFDLDAAVLTRNVRDFSLTPVRIETY
jgi:predicted nucleic acid-binding protein